MLLADNSEDEDVDDEESGKENRKSSLRKTDSRSKSSQTPARKLTRNHRQIPSSPEESEDVDSGHNERTSSSFEESDESGLDTSKRQALRNRPHTANRSNKVAATRKTRGDKRSIDETDDDEVKSNSKRNDRKDKGKKVEIRNRYEIQLFIFLSWVHREPNFRSTYEVLVIVITVMSELENVILTRNQTCHFLHLTVVQINFFRQLHLPAGHGKLRFQ